MPTIKNYEFYEAEDRFYRTWNSKTAFREFVNLDQQIRFAMGDYYYEAPVSDESYNQIKKLLSPHHKAIVLAFFYRKYPSDYQQTSE